jgi:hypothetical protein
MTINLNLKPIEKKIRFTWTRRKGRKPEYTYIWIADIHFKNEQKISKEEMKALIKIMKDGQTDVLTDGNKFYTCTGLGDFSYIKEISHPAFN